MKQLDMPITFAEHKEITAKDCEEVARLLNELASALREGNLGSFEEFWMEGGTEEGDAKIDSIRELIIMRYMQREGNLK
jgi:hypothetical protein